MYVHLDITAWWWNIMPAQETTKCYCLTHLHLGPLNNTRFSKKIKTLNFEISLQLQALVLILTQTIPALHKTINSKINKPENTIVSSDNLQQVFACNFLRLNRAFAPIVYFLSKPAIWKFCLRNSNNFNFFLVLSDCFTSFYSQQQNCT